MTQKRQSYDTKSPAINSMNIINNHYKKLKILTLYSFARKHCLSNRNIKVELVSTRARKTRPSEK